MDLDAAAEELYAGSPDDFVERRTALAAQARGAKDRALAKQIGALRRPTRTAWLLNLLSREAAEGVAELLSLGASLQDAQRRMAGAELRQLSAERRRLVDRLAREAVQLGAAHGYPAPDAALQEISQSLQAALADPGIGDQLRSGRMTAAASYGGFGPSDLMAAMAASLPAAVEQRADATEGAPQEPVPASEADDAAAEERGRLAARAEEAEAAWGAARAALDEAESAANEATAHADELADRIEQLRAELARTVVDEAAAREGARAARRNHQEARRAAAAAERARDAARRAQAEAG
jgi:hypothetical protein